MDMASPDTGGGAGAAVVGAAVVCETSRNSQELVEIFETIHSQSFKDTAEMISFPFFIECLTVTVLPRDSMINSSDTTLPAVFGVQETELLDLLTVLVL